jgi:hypothetical protein
MSTNQGESRWSDDLATALSMLFDFADVARGRVVDPDQPGFWSDRGWDSLLLGLSDDEVARLEARGLASMLDGPRLRSAVPSSLVELLERGREIEARLPREAIGEGAEVAMPGVSRRKQRQIRGLLGAISPSDAYRRVVDIGAGRGHFTRHVQLAWGLPAIGVERDEARAIEARRLAKGAASFVIADAFAGDLALDPRDLVVGLHACGSLGDLAVDAASQVGCDLVVVSCCLQKIRTEQRPFLSRIGSRSAVALDRSLLGLTNLYPRAGGVEVDLNVTMMARERRLALRWLLIERTGACLPGAEMRGLNRRWSRKGLEPLAVRALALRGLPSPTQAELAAAEFEGHRRFAAIRRLSLPRSAMARPLEITVNLDRAALAEERGYDVRVTQLVDAETTPRNIALFATKPSRG